MPRMRRLAFSWLLIAGLVALLGDLAIGQALIAPARHHIGPAPADLRAESVRIDSSAGLVSGWLSRDPHGKGVVLLLHGVRSDRRQMIPRARWLHRLGYSTLLIDLPGHGESQGAHITFGHDESKAVGAALDFLHRAFPGQAVGVIGVSLGAASTVLSDPDSPPDAVALESMYPTLRQAVADRLSIRFGRVGPLLSPLLLWQLPARLHVSADTLRPIDRIGSLGCPLLIASGSADLHTRIGEAGQLYAAASPPKEFWRVEGAGHIDLFDHDPQSYEARIGPFLAKHMHAARMPRE